MDEPISLPAGACLDVIAGHDPAGRDVWFVRCYGVDDTFKEPVDAGAVFCGRRLLTWLADVGAGQDEVWDDGIEPQDRTIWNAKLFPAVHEHGRVSPMAVDVRSGQRLRDQRQAWRSARRYSLEQILTLADHTGFYERRSLIRAESDPRLAPSGLPAGERPVFSRAGLADEEPPGIPRPGSPRF